MYIILKLNLFKSWGWQRWIVSGGRSMTWLVAIANSSVLQTIQLLPFPTKPKESSSWECLRIEYAVCNPFFISINGRYLFLMMVVLVWMLPPLVPYFQWTKSF